MKFKTPPTTAELRELLKDATPGPWCMHPNGTSVWNESQYMDSGVSSLTARILFRADTGAKAMHWGQAVADLDFIVALRNAAPSLLDELDAARLEIARLRDAIVVVLREFSREYPNAMGKLREALRETATKGTT